MNAPSPAAADAATDFIQGLAACQQVAALYPDEHPEYRDRATLAAVAGQQLHAAGSAFPLFLVRGGCYLGPTLLSRASLRHEALLERCAESGLVAVELTAPPTAHDVQRLTDVIRGAAPLATPIATVRVNHVMPSVHGVDTSAIVRGAAAQLATVFMRGTFARLADGGALDGEAVRTVGDRVAAETISQPSSALLMAALAHGGDDHLAEKSVKVARLVPLIDRALGWRSAPPAELALAGLLHDVGMAVVGRDIRDAPGPLPPAARPVLEAHPVEGAGILLEAGLPGIVVEAALHHHRGIDGSGYPAGGSPPPRIGWVVAVADRYAALTTRRPYRAPSLPVEALQRVQTARDLAPDVVAAFTRELGAYPPGSLVRLDTGDVALVVAANRELPTQPTVRLVLDAAGEPAAPETRDLSEWGGMGFRWDVTGVEDPATLGIDVDALLRERPTGTNAAAGAGAPPPAGTA